MKSLAPLLLAVLGSASCAAAEYHVSVQGNDAADGSRATPLRTISAAARLAQPGDVITVHEGVYRERINPPRGGQSDRKRIVYRAAPDEKVVITGSEIIKGWEKVQNDTWKASVPNALFGDFNPFKDVIQGEWCGPTGRHSGAVYFNGDWLDEARSLADVLKPVAKHTLHFAQVDATKTAIWAQFPSANPNQSTVEINVRQSVFYPSRPGINFITVRGFAMRHAATPWAGAMSEQVGLIGTHWSKGWIIENNDIGYSVGTGITLGRYALPKGQVPPATARGFVASIEYALRDGWSKENIGSHIVRNNRIFHCEKNAIHGSLGGAFSEITGNEIHDIAVRGWLNGPDIAAIKFLGGIDVRITGNHIYRNKGSAGIWLDWMAQGAQVTGNLLHDNSRDLFCEMQHGPLLLANNLLLSRHSALLNAQGLAFAQSLIAGDLAVISDNRRTPFHRPHSTEIARMHIAARGDHRFYNNLFAAACDLRAIDNSGLPCFAAGNVFTKGSQPSKFDADAVVKSDFEAGLQLTEKADGWYLAINQDPAWRDAVKRKCVTTELLGKAKVPNVAYENADGSPVRLDIDYFGRKRDAASPFPGPFELPSDGKQEIRVWPVSFNNCSAKGAAK